jgi:hypothetical protein
VAGQRSSPPARAEADWASQTADRIERVVGSFRGKTTEPVERVARLLVFGLLAAFLGIAAVVMLAILVVRVLDIAIPGEVWSAHVTAGGIFSLAGLFFWRKRSRKSVPA